MSRLVVSVPPAYFLDRYGFAFAVDAIEGLFLGNQLHERFVSRLSGGVAVQNFQPVVVYPVGVCFRNTFYHGADAFGEHVAVGIFPAFLQYHVYRDGVPIVLRSL